ncbi:ferrochelatase [Legionella brunensis]|uniref:Ferrochelatase n=1 Tax=Legionella brunensis TaxID=29422 RepID=A0A0W0SNE3_9GAMM|nr:ferrochelatase [Legionella brunensis]
MLGMRYGNPSLHKAIEELSSCESITVLPMYPQYSSAATDSSIERVLQLLAPQKILPSINLFAISISFPHS